MSETNKKSRGRPKNVPRNTVGELKKEVSATSNDEQVVPVKRGRGRPSKISVPIVESQVNEPGRGRTSKVFEGKVSHNAAQFNTFVNIGPVAKEHPSSTEQFTKDKPKRRKDVSGDDSTPPNKRGRPSKLKKQGTSTIIAKTRGRGRP